ARSMCGGSLYWTIAVIIGGGSSRPPGRDRAGTEPLLIFASRGPEGRRWPWRAARPSTAAERTASIHNAQAIGPDLDAPARRVLTGHEDHVRFQRDPADYERLRSRSRSTTSAPRSSSSGASGLRQDCNAGGAALSARAAERSAQSF